MIQEKNNVCKEVLTILSCCDNDFIEQIPSKVFKELIDLASDSEEEYYLNPNLELENQEISECSGLQKDEISNHLCMARLHH